MLFVEGRARAALEEFELTQNGVQQTYAALKAKLKEYFDSSSARESSMHQFDNRVQKANESEEEFMLQLLMLYQTANPDHAAEVSLLAIKRKFLAGISPSLRNKIFVFCTDPFAVAVTRELLLGHCRNARNLLSMQPNNVESTTDRVLVAGASNTDSGLLEAIHNISLQLNDHIRTTDARLDEFGSNIASMSSQRGDFRGRGNGGRGFRGNYNNNRSYNNNNRGNFRGGYNNRGGFGSGNRGGFRGGYRGNRGGYNNNNNRVTVRCFNCNGENHRAANCTANQGN